MTESIVRFLFNEQVIALADFAPDLTILQWLREQQQLTGSKEGCGSGDCGACTVVVASVEDEQLCYHTINSCIGFVASLNGRQLITVEHLKQGDKLHPVQQALVDHHASQCGFCTPGFVMSSFALHKHNPSPSRDEVNEALAGNLCRCTGYRPIIDAAMTSTADAPQDSFSAGEAQTISRLKALQKQEAMNADHCAAPKSTAELAAYLLKHPDATLLAGGTDLALLVTQQLQSIDKLVYLGGVAQLNVLAQSEDGFTIGAAVPYRRFMPLLAGAYPELAQMIERIGSSQIRNNGTLGGNIGNASPIGDMPPPLIALDAMLVLQRGEQQRLLPLGDYFKAYKRTALAPSEFIHSIQIPKPAANSHLKVYKVSKRVDDDISAVLAAIYLQLDNGMVKSVRIAFGGMAAIPKRAVACEQALRHQPWQQSTIDAAKAALSQEFSPLSDVRASAQYRITVAQNLLQKCFIELQQRPIQTRVINYA